MALAGGHRPHPRAVIFDLDRCLIDSRGAWRYCIEESFAAASNRRVSAHELVDEYHVRPWRDALTVIAHSQDEVRRCEALCEAMFERSAMKKLLVHEGVGMALDALRAERIELGAISRLPHALAVKQVQSTGLDRFLAVVVAAPWAPAAQAERCLRFLEAPPERCAFVGAEKRDLGELRRSGLEPYFAAWAGPEVDGSTVTISSPSELRGNILASWARRPAG